MSCDEGLVVWSISRFQKRKKGIFSSLCHSRSGSVIAWHGSIPFEKAKSSTMSFEMGNPNECIRDHTDEDGYEWEIQDLLSLAAYLAESGAWELPPGVFQRHIEQYSPCETRWWRLSFALATEVTTVIADIDLLSAASLGTRFVNGFLPDDFTDCRVALRQPGLSVE